MPATIDTTLYLSHYQTEKSKNDGKILGKDDFLKLLITQLKNQDPLNPMEDKDYIVQMAQFSTLEQMVQMSTALDKLTTAANQQLQIAYSQFIGKEINWHRLSEDEGDSGNSPVIEEGRGVVKALEFRNDTVHFVLDDGTAVEPAHVSGLNSEASEHALVQASLLIGKTVTFLSAGNNRQTETVIAVSNQDGKITFLLDDDKETKITADQILKIE